MLAKDRLFQLFLTIIEYRHLSLYAQWLEIISPGKKNFSQSIINLMYEMPIEHPEFTNIIRHIYSVIGRKKSKNVGV